MDVNGEVTEGHEKYEAQAEYFSPLTHISFYSMLDRPEGTRKGCLCVINSLKIENNNGG